MAAGRKPKDFRNAPFKDALKGASASVPRSAADRPADPSRSEPREVPAEEPRIDFASEMAALGVAPLADAGADGGSQPADAPAPEDDAELFLEALGPLSARFADEVPEENGDPGSAASADPRRMKQLRRGRIAPETQLDLHGLTRAEALEKVGYFLDNARFHGLRCVLLITGRGQNSPDGPVVRSAIEAYLAGPARPLVAEWARAPRQYGGEGALVVFLRDA